eukprot:g68471.t1
MSDDSDPEQPTPLKKAKTSQDDYDHEISSQNWEMLSQQVAKIKQDVQNLNDRFQRENISDVLENSRRKSAYTSTCLRWRIKSCFRRHRMKVFADCNNYSCGRRSEKKNGEEVISFCVLEMNLCLVF